MLALLRQAIGARPDNPILHLKLADLRLDRFEFADAAESLETARRLDPNLAALGVRLARCYNALGRYEETVQALAGDPEPLYERAVAWLGLSRVAEAEDELRGVLASNASHRHACWKLCKLLRNSGRTAESLDICETLASSGVRHAQLFYDWGLALALVGRRDRARALLLDPARVAEMPLPLPAGYADIAAFNTALASELLANPSPVTEFPSEEANRGSSRVHSLFAGRRPELIRGLLATLQTIVERWMPPRTGPFDPWLDARPKAARLKAWGLIQRGGDFEEWHTHRGGWLSGVYYVRVPALVATAEDGRGCIEYGPPPRLAEAMPGHVPPLRIVPREGFLLLAPSHYPHRTIPTGDDEQRISFAFDVVPQA